MSDTPIYDELVAAGYHPGGIWPSQQPDDDRPEEETEDEKPETEL